MLKLTSWIDGTHRTADQRASNDAINAAAAWQRIGDHPTSVSFKNRAGVTQAAQTVRLDWDNDVALVESEAGMGPRRRLIVLGVKGHPTIANTVIEEGYTFTQGGDQMRCVHVIQQSGQIEAEFESNG